MNTWLGRNAGCWVILGCWWVAASAHATAFEGDVPYPPAPERTTLKINRTWDVLSPATPATLRTRFQEAGARLGPWPLFVAGVVVDGPELQRLAKQAPDEPFVRVVREAWRRPVDVVDLLYFLDDVLRPEAQDLRGKRVYVTAGRARSAGLTLHPHDVFSNRPRRYGAKGGVLAIDKPEEPAQLPPAADGDLLGPNWSARFQNPVDDAARMAVLRRVNASYAERHASLAAQLRAQGAEVYVTSTVRRRERGYLMYGAFVLSRAKSARQVGTLITKLRRLNREWGLNIAVRWQHPEGWKATREAARAMADAYDVVYATEKGARSSNHYDGVAVDMVVLGLPRRLTLEAPSGVKAAFDLSAPEQARDLSLTPEVITWIEKHFEMTKLRSDYPHWDDARIPPHAEARSP